MLHNRLLLCASVACALTGLSSAQNDECTGALPLPLGLTAFDTTAATASAAAWPCGLGGGPDLWYSFTLPAAGSFRLSTCSGTTYDTVLEVFSGSCTALVSEQCNDDACGLQSAVGVFGMTGDTFFLRVGGYNGATGSGMIEVSQNVPVLNPANGHWYLAVSQTVDWPTAEASAASLTHMGLPGHLATITDQAENDFVYNQLVGGALGNAWLGGFQDLNSPTYSEPLGGWTWVTGEPFTFQNWTPGEPNNGGTLEHYLGYWPADQWNDYQIADAACGQFVVEFEPGDLGTSFCMANPNTTGGSGVLSAFGSPTVADNQVTLTAAGLPLNQFGIFITGTAQGFIPGPGGSQGNLCIGMGLGRYNGPGQLGNSGSSGSFSLALDLTATPSPAGPFAVQPGQTMFFQAWYRDFIQGQGAVSNFTDGVQIDFL